MSQTLPELAQDFVHTSKDFKQPKRVILRLRVNEFENCAPTEFDRAIMAYLASAGRSVDELQQRIHYSHIEPLQPPELKQTSFHIVLDIEKGMLKDPDFEKIEHEVHRVRRARDGTLSEFAPSLRTRLKSKQLGESDSKPRRGAKLCMYKKCEALPIPFIPGQTSPLSREIRQL
ncbi:hypothetical protein BDV28DRAFT_134968 [Aspergillus coremiiformis]|uniref:Uncharacterized protein n=1 Tax=Aspergillus coremiiformis TaxID=138285 RepID=A0A5N6Z944_9EURO|nr:hypothetical protein BDV28DRAFT_134968 [Aspergillus coremiiformis]